VQFDAGTVEFVLPIPARARRASSRRPHHRLREHGAGHASSGNLCREMRRLGVFSGAARTADSRLQRNRLTGGIASPKAAYSFPTAPDVR